MCKNTYSTGGASTSSCTACPGSMTTTGTGSTAKSDCKITCSAGYYLPAGAITCQECPDIGGYYCTGGTYYYNANTDQGATRCPSPFYGTTVSYPSSISECNLSCIAGQYYDASLKKCSSCPAGSYCASAVNVYYNNSNSNQGITGTCSSGYFSCPGGSSTCKY